MYYLLLISTILLMNSSCYDRGPDDELFLEKVPYEGKELRMDGFYYTEYTNEDGIFWDIYFFYRDGSLIYTGAPVYGLEVFEQHIINGVFDGNNISKYRLGVFQIKEDSIFFERWYPTERPLKAWIKSGIILNDTTFHITSWKRMKTDEVYTKDEIYKFKQFNYKPDSTNSYIK